MRLPLKLLLCGAILLAGCRGLFIVNSVPDAATKSPVKRVVVVVMQNHSFDNLFGAFPGAEGPRPGVPGYLQSDSSGKMVSPHRLTLAVEPALPHGSIPYAKVYDSGAMDKFAFYNGDLSMGYYDDTVPGVDKLWTYAQQNALADNYFDSVMGDAPPDVLQMVAARDTTDHTSVQPFYGPCNKPDARATPLTYRNLADQLNDKSIGWGWFQEALGVCGNYVPQENPFQFFTSTHDSPDIQDMSRFSERLLDGTLPSISFVQPGPGKSTHPGSGVTVAVGLNWLHNFIQSCQKSPAWGSMAIIVVWDEPGGWYDHVPPPQTVPEGYGMRVPMLVISPYARQGYISHTFMDHVSILKFIQWNWGLDPLNQRDQDAGDMREMFAF